MLAFIDTETTGLDPDLHEIWEVGLILRQEVGDIDHRWLLPVERLAAADAYALALGGFHTRHPQGLLGDQLGKIERAKLVPIEQFAHEFGALTFGAHLVGNTVAFDDDRLRRLFRSCGMTHGWDYHLVDVAALAAGRYGYVPPWRWVKFLASAGLDPAAYEAHTALGDAAAARDLYDAIFDATPDGT